MCEFLKLAGARTTPKQVGCSIGGDLLRSLTDFVMQAANFALCEFLKLAGVRTAPKSMGCLIWICLLRLLADFVMQTNNLAWPDVFV